MSETDAVAIAGFVVLFALMLLRVPVGMAMGLVGVSGYAYLTGGAPALKLVGQTSMRTVTDYTFGVIPMFLLMGTLVSNSGMSRELFRAANGFVGHLRGGLGIATVAACAGFAAICGSSVATAATFSAVPYPEMRRFGYPQSFATGVIAAGGTLGAMLPPSTVLAVYGIITEQDIGKLFMAGIIPGLLAMTMYMITIALIGYFRPGFLPKGTHTTWRERFAGLKNIWAPVLLFVFVIGGLYGLPFLPLFTPTEAGGGGAAAGVPVGRVHRAAGQRENPHLAAAGNPHRRRRLYGADRRIDLWIFPHGHANPAKGHGISHRPRSRQLRRPRPHHGDVPSAWLPDGRDGYDNLDGADHFSGHHPSRLRPDLVRRDHRDDGRTRPHSSPGRNECLRDQKRRQGRVICHDFQGRDPVRGNRPPPAGHSDCISIAGDLAADTHDGSLDSLPFTGSAASADCSLPHKGGGNRQHAPRSRANKLRVDSSSIG